MRLFKNTEANTRVKDNYLGACEQFLQELDMKESSNWNIKNEELNILSKKYSRKLQNRLNETEKSQLEDKDESL